MEHIAHMQEKRTAYNIFISRPEGYRPLGRIKHIKMDPKETVCEYADCIQHVA
jgi:hypothetical protein